MTDERAQELSVEERGAGSPVLLVHSSGMSSRQWRALAEELAPTHRVLSPDLTGIGRNPPWPESEPFHFRTDVEALSRILHALPEPAHVVGHSYGGLLAVTLARRWPDRVRSVAAYEPVAFGVLYDPPDAEALADLDRTKESDVWNDEARGGGEAWMEAFVDFWNGAGAWRALPEPTRQSFLRVGRKVYHEVTSLLTDRTPSSAYDVFRGPALFLHGERSPLAARRVAARLAEAFPNGEVLAVANAGHMGPLTHVRDVNDAIRRHVERA